MATYKTYPKLRLLTKEMTLKIEENCCPLAYEPQFTNDRQNRIRGLLKAPYSDLRAFLTIFLQK